MHVSSAESPLTHTVCRADFLPSLRRLFSNSVYNLIICTSLVAVNGFIGMITFKPKFMEQTYGQSPSKAIFLIGTAPLQGHLPHRYSPPKRPSSP